MRLYISITKPNASRKIPSYIGVGEEEEEGEGKEERRRGGGDEWGMIDTIREPRKIKIRFYISIT